MTVLHTLATDLRRRAESCRTVAATCSDPVDVARLYGKAAAYEHAAELVLAEAAR